MNRHQTVSHGGTVLVVDDNQVNQNLLSHMLTRQGYDVQMASDGVQALASAANDPPDLILLDIMMPGMDGYEVCQQLKADEATRDIPVIFISALDATEDKVKAFAAGGVDYIPKPFEVPEVRARVQAHLGLRALQRDLQREIVERDKLIAELDAFAHTVAHDLKTPLTSIIGYAQLLEQAYGSLPEEQIRHHLGMIAQRGRDMSNIIDELLLLAGVRKMEEVKMTALDMGSIISKTQRRLSDMIEEHQAQIILPDTWPSAIGYGPWIEEVWVNYISNAIKYGGQPPRVELGAMEQADGSVRFWVRDNGAGLSAEEQEHLFIPFTRLSQVSAKGHGLGLSIVRRIVEKLGKQVGVEGDVGEGSTFYFTLPAE
ncbi:MAG TPA: hybrid sensor histidine kinase/response regulator [Chloroflexi bacterium]|nr:hybrid sensor histidine kinase/response regulator [Chloroflexota bacterium]